MKGLRRYSGWLCIALLGVGLTGCVTKPPAEALLKASASWQERSGALAELTRWEAQGSLSLHHLSDDKKLTIVSYDWKQLAAYYQINLYSSLNLYQVRIAGVPGRAVTLWRSDTDYLTASDPEELVFKQFGWDLPVSNLVYWMRGLPAGDSPVTAAQLDDQHRLTLLGQDGWTITFADYTTQNGVDLPGSLQLTRPDWQIRVVIKSWSLM